MAASLQEAIAHEKKQNNSEALGIQLS